MLFFRKPLLYSAPLEPPNAVARIALMFAALTGDAVLISWLSEAAIMHHRLRVVEHEDLVATRLIHDDLEAAMPRRCLHSAHVLALQALRQPLIVRHITRVPFRTKNKKQNEGGELNAQLSFSEHHLSGHWDTIVIDMKL